MPKRTQPLDHGLVKLMVNSFNITNWANTIKARYGMPRRYAKAIILLGDVDLKGDVEQQIKLLILRNGLHVKVEV